MARGESTWPYCSRHLTDLVHQFVIRRESLQSRSIIIEHIFFLINLHRYNLDPP
uniref:Uncharacterized protein n=1 Tax=Oryza brachyantha TaxID=4533 RepID=J3LN08_ORYBR